MPVNVDHFGWQPDVDTFAAHSIFPHFPLNISHKTSRTVWKSSSSSKQVFCVLYDISQTSWRLSTDLHGHKEKSGILLEQTQSVWIISWVVLVSLHSSSPTSLQMPSISQISARTESPNFPNCFACIGMAWVSGSITERGVQGCYWSLSLTCIIWG